MSYDTEPKPALPFLDAKTSSAMGQPGIIKQTSAEVAREAGFSEEEVRYMLDLPEEPGPPA